MKRIILGIVCWLIAGAAHALPFTAIYAFGDSEVDNGNRLALQGKPRDPYWEGRHSNGKVSVEVYAETLGVPLVDYGYGGAFTGHGNTDTDVRFPSLANTGVLDQLGMYTSAYGSADAGALYFIYAGSNDFSGLSGDEDEIAAGILNNYKTMIDSLGDLGARHFMVANRTGSEDFSVFLEDGLAQLAAETGFDITFFDTQLVELEMLDPDNPFGFLTDEPCYLGTLLSGGAVCDNPDETVYWDKQGHFSAAAQAVLGERMAEALPGFDAPNAVPEGNALLLLLAAFLAFGLTRVASLWRIRIAPSAAQRFH